MNNWPALAHLCGTSLPTHGLGWAFTYIFHVSTTMTLAFFFHLPELDESFHSEYRDLPEPVRLPGCVPVQGRDLVEPVQDRENDAYKLILRSAKQYRLAKGIIFNSFIDLEPEAIKELQKEKPGRPPVYPVGLLVNVSHAHNEDDGSESECLKWLDEQPHGSVLFVSFGSGWSHTSAQLKEIAEGLEMSEERFMWVVRSPNDKQADAFSAKAETQTDHLFETLLEGFVERTKGRGLLVTSWAPQAKILSYGSTGGFMSHSGWNSVLESMVNGVPLVVWPMYAEQKMNATFLTEDIKVVVRPEVNESSGLVEREEIARVVKGLMKKEEGNEVRLRMKKLKEATANAYRENGCSTKQIARLARMWNNKII
ncbi:hydroquinone glucosyltransferase-like [Senna tora]|uniref:Hydroquinone glucosyltransferase-like n=1 Tax=Senna tora TaxID=362788 RepID=A0A835CMH4_9FABA|nr:hydroquinone glucosyltransferase-like [Senna tora]